MILTSHAILTLLVGLGPAGADDPRPPIRLEDASRMDAEVVATIERAAAAVEAANGDASEGALALRGQAWSQLGIAYEANTMWSLAEPCYAQAFALLPDKPEWLYRQGVCLHATGELDRALEVFRSASEKLTNTAVVQARYGDTALTLGLVDEAGKAWERAIASEAQLGGEIRFAESRVGLAQVRVEQERWDEAQILLREALELNPGYAHARYLLGTVLAELGNETEAEFQLQLGLNAFPVFPPDPHGPLLAEWKAGYGQRMMNVENQLAAGDSAGALQALEAVRAERPDDFMVLNLIARAHQQTGAFDQALAVLQQSIELAPDEYMTRVDLAVVLLNLQNNPANAAQRGDLLNQARAAAEKAVQLAPHIGRAWYYRGLVEYVGMDSSDPQAAQQTVQSAMAAMQRAHLLGCREPQMLELLAQLYAQQGNTREMVKFAEAHTRRSPENPMAWVFLARAQFTVKDYDAARVAADRALTVSGNDPQLAGFRQQLDQAIQQAQNQ